MFVMLEKLVEFCISFIICFRSSPCLSLAFYLFLPSNTFFIILFFTYLYSLFSIFNYLYAFLVALKRWNLSSIVRFCSCRMNPTHRVLFTLVILPRLDDWKWHMPKIIHILHNSDPSLGGWFSGLGNFFFCYLSFGVYLKLIIRWR